MTLRLLIPAVMLALGLVACGGDSAPAEPTPEPTATPAGSGPAEQALARYVQTTLNAQFLEDCSTAIAETDVNKICSTFRGERNGQRAYALGQTFSEGTQWAFLAESNGQWTVVHAPPITPENAAIPGIPWPLVTGVDVVITGAGSCGDAGNGLNVREGPSLQQRAVDCISDGTVVQLSSGPAMGDGISWWQLAGRTGWVSGDYLRYPDAAQ